MPRKRTASTETVQATALELIRTGIKPTNRNVKKTLGCGGTDSIARDLREMDAHGLWKRMRPTSAKQAPRVPIARPGATANLPHQAKAASKSKELLLAEIVELKLKVAQLEQELLSLKTNRQYDAPPASGPTKTESITKTAPFEGMSISDAAIFVLREHGQPMSTMRIAYTLESRGFKFVKEPSRAVNSALFYRAKERNDVIKVGYSTWGLPSRDTPSSLRPDISYSSKTDQEYQVERMQLAHKFARERGMSVGRPAFEKTHPFKVILEYRRLRESGARVYEALDACGIKRSSYYKYRSAIENAASETEFCKELRQIRQDAHSS